MIDNVEEMYVQKHDKLLDTCQKLDHNGIRTGYYTDEDQSHGEAVRAMRRQIYDSSDISASDHVLDIGCGFGDCLVWLADRVGVTGTGINIAEPQLEVARELAARQGVADIVRFCRGDFHDLHSIVNDPVDVVWASEALMHTTNDETVVEQMADVLTNDGQVAISGIFVTRRSLLEHEQQLLKTFHAGRSAHLSHVEDLTDALVKHGFTNVECRKVTEHVIPGLRRGYRFIRWLYLPLLRVLSLFGRKKQSDLDAVSALVSVNKLVKRDALGYFIVSAERDE